MQAHCPGPVRVDRHRILCSPRLRPSHISKMFLTLQAWQVEEGVPVPAPAKPSHVGAPGRPSVHGASSQHDGRRTLQPFRGPLAQLLDPDSAPMFLLGRGKSYLVQTVSVKAFPCATGFHLPEPPADSAPHREPPRPTFWSSQSLG